MGSLTPVKIGVNSKKYDFDTPCSWVYSTVGEAVGEAVGESVGGALGGAVGESVGESGAGAFGES